MMKKFNDWLYRLAVKHIIKNIVYSKTRLTPEYLLAHGWIEEDGYYTESNIKDRYRIYIKFEDYYYRIFYSANKTFITLESSLEWFEMYYLLLHPYNGRYKIVGL